MCWPRLGGDVRADLLEDGVLPLGPHHASLLLTVLEQDEGRDAHHAEALCGGRVLVHVQLHDAERLPLLPPDLLDDRGDHVARDAPVRPEVDQDGHVRAEYLVVELLIRGVYGVAHCSSCFAVKPASPPAHLFNDLSATRIPPGSSLRLPPDPRRRWPPGAGGASRAPGRPASRARARRAG